MRFVHVENKVGLEALYGNVLSYALELFVGPCKVFVSNVATFNVLQGLGQHLQRPHLFGLGKRGEPQVGFLQVLAGTNKTRLQLTCSCVLALLFLDPVRDDESAEDKASGISSARAVCEPHLGKSNVTVKE